MYSWRAGERPCRLLVIEDNDGDVYLIRQALEHAGLQVVLTTFSDGKDALDFVTRHGNAKELLQPDLVLLDLNIPKSSGREIIAAIRASSYMAEVPVAILTSSVSLRDKA